MFIIPRNIFPFDDTDDTSNEMETNVLQSRETNQDFVVTSFAKLDVRLNEDSSQDLMTSIQNSFGMTIVSKTIQEYAQIDSKAEEQEHAKAEEQEQEHAKAEEQEHAKAEEQEQKVLPKERMYSTSKVDIDLTNEVESNEVSDEEYQASVDKQACDEEFRAFNRNAEEGEEDEEGEMGEECEEGEEGKDTDAQTFSPVPSTAKGTSKPLRHKKELMKRPDNIDTAVANALPFKLDEEEEDEEDDESYTQVRRHKNVLYRHSFYLLAPL